LVCAVALGEAQRAQAMYVEVQLEELFESVEGLGEQLKAVREALRGQLAFNEQMAKKLKLALDRKGFTTVRPPRASADFELTDAEVADVLVFCKNTDNRLGLGGFGEVFRGEFRGGDVAIKVAFVSEGFAAGGDGSAGGWVVEQFKREVEAMRLVNSRSVVKLIGACTRAPTLLLVMELVPGGDLATVLRSPEKLLNHGQLLRIAVQVASALEEMHAMVPPMVHRDVKASNVLVTCEYQAKLCDLGLARCVGARGHVSTLGGAAGTVPYMAPEVVLEEEKAFTEAVDVYAFGVMLAEMFLGYVPHKDTTQFKLVKELEMYQKVNQERVLLKEEEQNKLPAEIWAVVYGCTRMKQENRLEMRHVRYQLAEVELRGSWKQGVRG
jgi:serine/threonine protein kinase